MPDTTITQVRGRRIWDSRGRPTVEAEVELACGAVGRASAPAGASKGRHEALERRDGGKRLRGFDVTGALASLNETLDGTLRGLDAIDQSGVDHAMIEKDRTANKSRLGANAIVAVSMALLHATAAAAGVPLWQRIADLYCTMPTIPLPEIQIFGGGAHAGRRVDIQDFMIMVPGAVDFVEALEITAEVYHAAGAVMARRGKLAGVADEGGWWPQFSANEEALDTLCEAIIAAGETPGERVVISLDIAASEFHHDGHYWLALEDRALDSAEMIDMLGDWINAYPIVSIEDPLAETDIDGMVAFTRQFGERLQIVGDDLLVTSADRVDDAARTGSCNALLTKVNQAGTVTEAVAAFEAARRHGFGTIISARSGETEDVTISHLAVGLGAGQLKVGAFARSERMAKWNECLRISEHVEAGTFEGNRPLIGRQ